MLLLGMFVFEELAGIGSGAVLLSNMVYLFLRQRPELAQTLQGEWWIAGTFFCGFWYVRENILMNIERNKRKIGDGK